MHSLDASDDPDDDLIKEVCARFGLCVYLSQLCETRLITILTTLKTADSQQPTRQTFDALYLNHERLTFGNLLNELLKCGVLSDDLLKQLRDGKNERDQLAHRFFRDHDMNFVTVGGCHLMLEILEGCQGRFDALEGVITGIEKAAFAKVGFDASKIDMDAKRAGERRLDEARTRFSSRI